jgi:general secretion pathway protein G
MSQPTATRPQTPLEARRRRQTQYLIAVGSIVAVGVLAAFLFLRKPPEPPAKPPVMDEHLREVIAALDRDDPRWRFEALEQDRRPFPPDRENPGPNIHKLGFLLEEIAPRLSADYSVRARKGLREGSIKDRKQAGLEPAAAVIETARGLRGYGLGRHTVPWKYDNPLMTSLPHKAETIAVVDLLTLDAEMRAHEGKVDEALESVLAALIVVRAIGDEPMMATQIQRPGFHALCTRALEESLRLGQANRDNLKSVQNALLAEADEPWLKYGARGERAGLHGLMTALENGSLTKADQALLDSRAEGVALILSSWKARPLGQIHAALLEYTTQFIQVLDLPPKDQAPRIKALADSLKDAPREALPLLSAFLANDLLQASRTGEAALRCAAVGMALERYRLATGKWPENLDDLVTQKVLSKVPIDPFEGEQPLRYERTKEGVLVYSVGADGKRGNRFERSGDSDPSFRLWNVEARSKPAK